MPLLLRSIDDIMTDVCLPVLKAKKGCILNEIILFYWATYLNVYDSILYVYDIYDYFWKVPVYSLLTVFFYSDITNYSDSEEVLYSEDTMIGNDDIHYT